MKTYVKGDSYKVKGTDFKAFGITEIGGELREHVNKIEVYGDKKLRNLIISLLNSIDLDRD